MTERWIDQIDPYGYARQSGLKVSYVAIIFFMVNAFWKAPTLPVLAMCVAGAGIALIEMPSINTAKKKDQTYIVFTVLTIITVSVFGFFRYFTVVELIGVIGWAYVLYRLVATNTEKAQVVAIVLLIGFVSLEGLPASDFWQWAEQTIFYVQFAAIAFIAHKLFPNRYFTVVENAMRQIWLQQRKQLQGAALTTLRTDDINRFMAHLSALDRVRPLLPKLAQAELPALINELWNYQCIINAVIRQGPSEKLAQTLAEHERWFTHINRKSSVDGNDRGGGGEGLSTSISHTATLRPVENLKQAWNTLCQAS